MKRFLNFMLIITAILFLGSINVNAKSAYWEKYFQYIGDLPNYGGCSAIMNDIHEWKNEDMHYNIEQITCGGGEEDRVHSFKAPYYGYIINDVSNVTVKSSNDEIVTAEVKPYDFSKEIQYYNDFITEYNNLSFEQFKKDLIAVGRGDEANKYKEKPTWWEFNGYESEPTTWWEAYKLEAEPKNAVQIITHGHDLGKATITVSADNKDDISINWLIQAKEFNSSSLNLGLVPTTDEAKELYNNKAQGFVDILNNLDKYKDVIPEKKDYKNYNFSYNIEEKEDISEVINALKGKDITVNFKSSNGIDYTLNGLDIKSTVDKGFTYSYNISMETSINKDKINSLVDLKDAIYIDFSYHGKLPTKYTLSVNVRQYIDKTFSEKLGCDNYNFPSNEYTKCYENVNKEAENYLKNTEFTLLYFNPDTNKMEVVKDKLKAAENTITLEFDHFSSYVLASDYQTKPEKEPETETPQQPTKPTTPSTPSTPNNAQTGTTDVVLYIVIAIITLGSMIYLVLNMKRDAKD